MLRDKIGKFLAFMFILVVIVLVGIVSAVVGWGAIEVVIWLIKHISTTLI